MKNRRHQAVLSLGSAFLALMSLLSPPSSARAAEGLCEILDGYTDVFLPMPAGGVLASTMPPQGAMMPLAGAPFMFGLEGNKASLDTGEVLIKGQSRPCVDICTSGPFYVIWDQTPATGNEARTACRMAVGAMANTAGIRWEQ